MSGRLGAVAAHLAFLKVTQKLLELDQPSFVDLLYFVLLYICLTTSDTFQFRFTVFKLKDYVLLFEIRKLLYFLCKINNLITILD